MIRPVYMIAVVTVLAVLLAVAIIRPTDARGALIAKAVSREVPSSQLPAATPSEDIATVRDVTIFDLSAWPGSRNTTGRRNPARMTNVLTMRKLRQVNTLVVHYSTTGWGIDFRCIFPRCTVRHATHPQHPGERTYAVAFDVSNIRAGEEFPGLLEAVYWNGFRNPKKESASTYTGSNIQHLEELVLAVLLPSSKPLQQLNPTSSAPLARPVPGLTLSANGRYVYWRIDAPRPDAHYTLDWDW